MDEQMTFAWAVQENTEKLVRGIFEYDSVKLRTSVSRIELTVDLNKEYTGSFSIDVPNEEKTYGTLYVSNKRLRLSTTEFYDSHVEIEYTFDSTGMEEGDVLKGEISVISGAGEYVIPFVVSIRHSVIQTSVGNLKNLFHFTNLAQSDFDEAVKVFYSEEFKKIFINNDREFYDIYLGLSGEKYSRQNVEEFLISIHKKVPISYRVTQESVELNGTDENQEYMMCIQKSGWGLVQLELSTDAPFISLEKTVLTDDDFLGNVCEVPVTILAEELHGGRNYGSVTLSTLHSENKVEFTIRNEKKTGKEKRKMIQKRQKMSCDLMRIYIEFRIHNINKTIWEKQSLSVVEQMISLDDNDIEARLYQAQILLSQGRQNEVNWLLEHINRDMDVENGHPALYGYYLYLLALNQRDRYFVKEKAEQIHALYLANRSEARLLWFLLYLDEELNSDPQKQLIMLEHQFETGSTSPLLYIEAYHIFSSNPMLLTKLDEFEIQILNFAVKTELYQAELVKQAVYACSKVKRFLEALHRILCDFYEEYETDEILTALCVHLMKAEVPQKDAFMWFGKAIERELRITRLYEYYMYAVSDTYQGELPRMVQMYFAYSSNLEYRKNAYLYANLIRHRENNEQILRSYESQMEQFVLNQIAEGHVNENLAEIYEYMKDREQIRRALGKKAVEILFAHHFICKDSRVKYLILIEKAKAEEIKVPLVQGEVVLPVFGQEYHVFTEDDRGNRFDASIPVEDIPMMKPMEFLEEIRENETDEIGIQVFLCEGNRHYISIDESNRTNIQKIVESEQIRESYKKELRKSLIQYYYDHDQMRQLDEYLININPKILCPPDRAELLEYMVRRGMQEEAYEIISVYGSENITSKILVKLCSKMITDGEYEENDFLLSLCHIAFRAGKYDVAVLTYLVKYFYGTTKHMRNVWNAAINFDVDAREMEERLLTQMLYTRAFVGEKEDIFESYQRHGASKNVEVAYLSYNAYEYLIKDAVMDDRFFERLLMTEETGDSLNDISRLSIICYTAEQLQKKKVPAYYDERAKVLICNYIRELLKKNIVFEFFQEFNKDIPELCMHQDKTYIEYKTNPGSRVVLHYVLESEGKEDVVYKKEEMKNMINGIFTRNFILFFGETLQYYITEESLGKEHLTQSLVINKTDITMGGRESRYDVLNDMLVSLALKDDASLLNLIDLYRKKTYVTKHLFTVK